MFNWLGSSRWADPARTVLPGGTFNGKPAGNNQQGWAEPGGFPCIFLASLPTRPGRSSSDQRAERMPGLPQSASMQSPESSARACIPAARAYSDVGGVLREGGAVLLDLGELPSASGQVVEGDHPGRRGR